MVATATRTNGTANGTARSTRRNGSKVKSHVRHGRRFIAGIGSVKLPTVPATPASTPRLSRAEIEQKIRTWEAKKEAAARLFGEMNALEERLMHLLYEEKSAILSDGRVVVVLDSYRDPNGLSEIHTDHIQILPAGVLPQ